MMIDKETGAVEINIPATKIPPNMPRDDFLKSPLYSISSPLNQNPPWSRYAFKSVIINEDKFVGDICFNTEKLYSITLAVIRPEFGTSWGEWSEEKELARKRYHENLLRTIFGESSESYSFPWGKVISLFDRRAGGSAIEIYYV